MSTPKKLIVVDSRIADLLATLPASAICGLDEVGRGPLAGPVTAACVILSGREPAELLADSKALSPDRRARASQVIQDQALAWGLGWVWPEEIETLNIHFASLEAMSRAHQAAVAMLTRSDQAPPELALVDGKHCPDLPIRTLAQIKGDALIPAIGAASIIAKVARDRWIEEQSTIYPGYGFAQHKGYPTKNHVEALKRLGPCAIHRQTWVAKILRASSAEITQLFEAPA